MGQDAAAAGQEEQFSPGTQADFSPPREIYPCRKFIRKGLEARVAPSWIFQRCLFLPNAHTLQT